MLLEPVLTDSLSFQQNKLIEWPYSNRFAFTCHIKTTYTWGSIHLSYYFWFFKKENSKMFVVNWDYKVCVKKNKRRSNKKFAPMNIKTFQNKTSLILNNFDDIGNTPGRK